MFHDVRCKGERILYELSMQEAATQYGGFLEGFDCPFGFTFWNVTSHTTNQTTVNQNAICLLETDAGFPLSRHCAGGGLASYPF